MLTLNFDADDGRKFKIELNVDYLCAHTRETFEFWSAPNRLPDFVQLSDVLDGLTWAIDKRNAMR